MSWSSVAVDVAAAVWLPLLWKATWTGGLAVLLALVATRALPRLPSPARCWLWRLVFVKLLLGLLWLPPLSLAVLPPQPGSRSEVVRDGAAPGSRADTAPGIAAGYRDGALPRTGAGGPFFAGQAQAWRALLPERAERMLFLVWLLGAGVFALRLLHGWHCARQLRAGSGPLEGEAVPEILNPLCARFALPHVPQLLCSEVTAGPVLLGLRNPAIVLPRWLLTECPTDEWRSILAHELAHLKRRDLAWHWFTLAVRGLFFYHPLVWLAEAELRDSQEAACDAEALRRADLPAADYSRLLIKVATLRRPTGASLAPVLGVSEGFRSLERRLMAMKQVQFGSRAWNTVAAVLTTVAVVGLLPWQLGPQSAAAAPETEGRPARSAARNPVFEFDKDREGWLCVESSSKVAVTRVGSNVKWGAGALEWDYSPTDGNVMLSRPNPRLRDGATTLDFWLKGSVTSTLQLYLVERSGAVYHMHLRPVAGEWQHYQVPLSDLTLGEMGDPNGHLDLGEVQEIVIQDLSRYHTVPGLGLLRPRKLWLDHLTFTSEKVPVRRAERSVGGHREVLFDDFSAPLITWAARTGIDMRTGDAGGRSALRAAYEQGTSAADQFRITNHFDPRYRDMRAFQLTARATQPTRLRVSLREFNGSYTGPEWEAFCDLPAGKEWTSFQVPTGAFKLSGGAGKQRRLNLAQVWLLSVEDTTPEPGTRPVTLDIDSISAVMP